jgi:hypothetical protein
MAIHIGTLIKKELELRRLTFKEFGALINRNEKTIPDILSRSSIHIDLLVVISAALKKDFISVFYTENPLKSLRNDEVVRLHLEIQLITDQLQRLAEENKSLKSELTVTKDLNAVLKDFNALANAQIEDYKVKINDVKKNAFRKKHHIKRRYTEITNDGPGAYYLPK